MEDFTFLHLDIGSGGALESLLKIFFNEEEVDYVCEECRAHTKSLRRSSLSRLPQVLIIVLKRFSQIQGWKTVKNESKVVFPETGLDVYGSRYDCYAIVNHEGSLNFGHYTACVKMSHAVRSGERAWHKYNDGKVSKMNSLNPKGSTEYILFYEMAKN